MGSSFCRIRVSSIRAIRTVSWSISHGLARLNDSLSSNRRSAFLVLTGGSFVIGPLTTHSYVIGLRMPLQGLTWDFRTTDLDHVVDKRSACDGTLFVNATSRNKRRRLEVLLVGEQDGHACPHTMHYCRDS